MKNLCYCSRDSLQNNDKPTTKKTTEILRNTIIGFAINEARKNEIKKKRSAILHQIRTILREEGDRFWQSRADIADSQPDPRSYYADIRQLRQKKAGKKPSPVALMDDNGHMISNMSWSLNKISEYYSSIFYRDDLPSDLRSSEFADVNDQPFTVSEIAAAIMN